MPIPSPEQARLVVLTPAALNRGSNRDVELCTGVGRKSGGLSPNVRLPLLSANAVT